MPCGSRVRARQAHGRAPVGRWHRIIDGRLVREAAIPPGERQDDAAFGIAATQLGGQRQGGQIPGKQDRALELGPGDRGVTDEAPDEGLHPRA